MVSIFQADDDSELLPYNCIASAIILLGVSVEIDHRTRIDSSLRFIN